eukprot:sb/3476996/
MLVVDVLHHVRLEEQFLDDGTLYRYSVGGRVYRDARYSQTPIYRDARGKGLPRFSQDEPEYSSTLEYSRPSDNPNTELNLYQLCFYGKYLSSRNRLNQEILVPDWLVTSHVT